MEQLYALAKQWDGREITRSERLPIAGSDRSYYRLFSENGSIIGVIGTSVEENRAFVTLAKHFYSKKLSVPQILAVNPGFGYYLQEDLGTLSLFDAIAGGRNSGNFSAEERKLLVAAIKELPRFQFEGAAELDFNVCYPQPAFDRRTIIWDLNYFKYCFLKLAGIEFREDLLEDDFSAFTGQLLAEESETFMYRDFQSRNVMIKEGKPFFIDFQGGRKGPVYYDVASFIGQAKARLTPEIKEELLTAYLQALQSYCPVSERHFREKLHIFTLFRTLQVLGAYGFRGYIEHKSHFIQSIPYAIDNLRTLLQKPLKETPYLNSLLEKLVNTDKFRLPVQEDELTVTIYSFSFHKGIPEDPSGNGGGFVFDCRALDNPGRYEEYRTYTGLDRPVIEFFDRHPAIHGFIKEAGDMVGRSVETYRKRGFRNLMISFGCTGGQHRSVFAAQRLAEHISAQYRVKVHVIHREQNIQKIYPAKKDTGL
ncbi:MAG: RNase adapter RapZ [Bacteroidales bacterium]|nr:RNase adapter RapZ [Bacteroidales bacterium]